MKITKLIHHEIIHLEGDVDLSKCDITKDSIILLSTKDIIAYSVNTSTYSNKKLKKMNIYDLQLEPYNYVIVN